MRVGTKSVLFGVHCFWWHPLTVARAWVDVYGRWPRGYEWAAVLLHDVGYWGCPNMDGEEGQRHPLRGAALAAKVVLWLTDDLDKAADAYFLSLYHSRHFAAQHGVAPGDLFLPDKLSVRYDPAWFYLLRARLSGEILEYRENARMSGRDFKSDALWFKWYRTKVEGFCKPAR